MTLNAIIINIVNIDSFKTAKERAALAEDTSNVGSDSSEDLETGKRRKRLIRLNMVIPFQKVYQSSLRRDTIFPNYQKVFMISSFHLLRYFKIFYKIVILNLMIPFQKVNFSSYTLLSLIFY